MINILRYLFIFIVLGTLGLGKVYGAVVTRTVGSSGANHLTLSAAFTYINGINSPTTDYEIQIITDITEATTPVVLVTPTRYNSVIVYPTGSTRTISRAGSANPIIDFAATSKLTIDGRLNKTGAANSLVISNTNAAASTSTIRFRNSSTNNTIRYCTIMGSETDAASGVLFFTTSASGNGNDNNVIEYNSITCAGTNRPLNAIYSAAGTSGTDNSGNTIRNNNIYNFLNGGTASNGIQLAAYNTGWTITGNSFYETTSWIPTASVAYNVINISAITSSNITISSNYIGGSAASCSGTWVKTTFNNQFTAININAGATACSINSNKIKGIDWSNSSSASWTAINIAAGAANIGTSGGNRIGGATGNDSILVTAGANGGLFYGINIASSGAIDCQNNIIGALNSANSNTANASNLYGIYKTSTGTTTISNNTIGSTSTSNSMHASSASTGQNQNLMGISASGNATITMDNNTISNLTNACSNSLSTSASQIIGISSTSGDNTISNNTIKNLSISNGNTEKTNACPIIGIALTASGTNSIFGNTIFNLSNDLSSNFGGNVFGLYLGGTGSSLVYKNFIHTLSILAPTSSSSIVGIKIAGSTQTLYNNIVSLDVAKNTNLFGILDNTGLGSVNTQDTKIYFNTIYIGGTITGTESSYAIQSTFDYGDASCLRDYRNNIFYNARASAGTDYAINYSSGTLTSLTANYNNYYVTGTSGIIGYSGSNLATLADIQAATSQDTYSEKNNPGFTSGGSTTATDYKISEEFVGVAEAGMGITDDYGSNTREYFTMMGAWEGPINKWKGTDTDDWNTASNWTRNYVPAVDASIIFHDFPVNHCVQDQNRSVMHIFNNTAYHTVLNSKKLTLKGNLEFGVDAKVDASATNSNLEFAGALPQEIKDGCLLNNEVYDLTINNTTNLKLNGTLRLLNTIIPTAARLDANTTFPTVSYAGTAPQLVDSVCFTEDKVYNLNIDNASGASLKTNFFVDNNLSINSGKLLIIPTKKLLTVNISAGSVTNDAGTSGLVIKANSTDANGSLIYPQGLTVPATVEMYSKASWNLSDTNIRNRYKWQFIGIPVSELTASPTFIGGYVRKLVETAIDTASHWSSLTAAQNVEPFIGYEICQEAAKTYSFAGNLVSSDYNSGELAYTISGDPFNPTLYPGQHLLANPYAAAIDIYSLLNGANLGSNMEQSVYLYNSGTFANWQVNNGEITNNGTTTTPGQYTVSTAETAGFGGVPAQIPSMQAFLVKAMSTDAGNTVNIPYASVARNSEIQRARGISEKLHTNDKAWTRIDLKGKLYSDQVWIFTDSTCSRKFNNGWDGRKLFGSSLAPQLFAMEADGNYQINAVADMNNTDLGFLTGNEKEFTMKFTHENIDKQNSNIYLFDLVAKTTTDITLSGTEYKFTAEPNTKVAKRFKLITSKLNQAENDDSQMKIYTTNGMIFIQNNSNESGDVKIYDISGKLIQQKNFSANNTTALFNKMSPGVYLAKTINNGKEITKSLIVY